MGTRAIASSTSNPSNTVPNITWKPSSASVAFKVIPNSGPTVSCLLVSNPLLLEGGRGKEEGEGRREEGRESERESK